MALKKEVETNFGIKADYWRLDMIVYNKKDSTISGTFNLYKDKEAAHAAKEPFSCLSFIANIEKIDKDLREICYEKAKELILQDAEDC